jgi:hypothetical protein
MNKRVPADYGTKVLLKADHRIGMMTHDPMNCAAHTFFRKSQSATLSREMAAHDSATSINPLKSPTSESSSEALGASIRIGLTVDEIKQAFRDNLVCRMGRLEAAATKHDLHVALVLTVRDRLFQRSVGSMENYGGADTRRVAYLSAEFLRGPHLANNLLNFGITEPAREALRGLGHGLDEIVAQEEEEEPRPRQRWARAARVVLHGFARVPKTS